MPPNRILVDSGFLYSLYSADEPNHDESIEAVEFARRGLIIPYVTLTEAAFLCRRDGGVRGVIRFLDAISKAGHEYAIIAPEDLIRARDIMAEYIDARLDFVDCCIMALSERLGVMQVFTYDQRDFGIFRPKHCDYLELLP